nr:hypothetical protein [Candidatus Sigynarchaeota archaeon]
MKVTTLLLPILVLTTMASIAIAFSAQVPGTNDTSFVVTNRGIDTSNRNTQQPENGLWCEYVSYQVINGTVTNASWMYVNVTYINATHYRIAVEELYDNQNTLHRGWYVVEQASSIVVEISPGYWPITGSRDNFIAPNESAISTDIGPYMMYSAPDTYNVTRIEYSNIWSENLMVLQGKTVAENVTAKYLINSGLLVSIYVNDSHPGDLLPSYQAIELGRTNINAIGNYYPAMPAHEPWLRYDISYVNRTTGTMKPLASEFAVIDKFSPTGYNLSLAVTGNFGSNNTFSTINFNISCDTVIRLMDSDWRGPFPFNMSGVVMGLNTLQYDPTWNYPGQIVAMSMTPFGSSNAIIIPAVVSGLQTFRGVSCWKIDSLPGTHMQA